MPLDPSRQERTGWRDEEISRRHRAWGFNCPARDIDFLMVESDRRLPVALIDYKHVNASTEEIHSKEHLPIIHMADTCGIPFFVVLYDIDTWWFTVYSKNDAARIFIDGWCNENFPHEEGRVPLLTEYDFVRMLYALRGRDFFSDRRVNRSALIGADNDNEPVSVAA